MKYLTKSLLVASVFALLAAAAAQADDQQLTNRLIIQNQQQSAALQRATSVAVYAGNGGAVGNRDAQEPGTIYELRPNGHGQSIGLYRQAPLQ